MKYQLIISLLGLTLLAGFSPARADVYIDEVVVANSPRELLLYFRLQNAITPEMEQGVKSGLPLSFTFFVEIYRHRTLWPNQLLFSAEFNHHLSYDSLKDEFRIVREEEGEAVLVVNSIAEARRMISRVSGLPLISLDQLLPGQTYTVRVRARLSEWDQPFAFSRALPPRRLWSFATDWHSVEFGY